METMMIEKENSIWGNDFSQVWRAWLHVDGKPVSYVRLMAQDGYRGYLCVCDIETREGYQNQGYAKKLLAMASEELGKPLATSGSFTPEGFTAFYGKLPTLVGHEAYDRPTFRSMTFVYSWEEYHAM